MLAGAAVAARYGGLLVLHESRTRVLNLCVATDFSYRAARPDWESSLEGLFAEVNRTFAKTGVQWRVRSGGEAYPPQTPGTMLYRLRAMGQTATCRADVVLGLTGRADRNANSAVTPFSHALLVSDTAANSQSVTATVIARALAELFGAPASTQTLILADAPDGEVFDAATVNLIRSTRDYDFANGISSLNETWERRGLSALTNAMRGRTQHPEAEAHRILAQAFAGGLDYAKAAVHFRQAAQEDPENADLRVELAMSLEFSSQSEQAVHELKQAVLLDPDSALPHAAMGAIYLNSRRVDAAIKEFQEATRLDRRNASYQAALGEALSQDLGRAHEAVAAFHAAVELRPLESGAFSGLLSELNAEKRYRQSVLDAEAEVRLKPSSPQARLRAGVALAYAGDLDAALNEIRRAVDLDPSNGKSHLALARAYHQAGRYAEADSEIRAALSVGVNPPFALVEDLDRKLGRTPGKSSAPKP
jgi:Flp pilus assembly protein TadD